MMFLDGVIITSALMLALAIRDERHRDYLYLIVASLPVWIGALAWAGVYRSLRVVRQSTIVWMLVKAVFVFSLVQWAMVWLAAWGHLSRPVLLLYPLMAAVLLSATRLFVMFGLARIRRRGYDLRSVAIVGTGPAAVEYARILRTRLKWGL